MKNLIKKELRLAVSPLSLIFILFALMTLLPGYPILMGAFFICLGIFQSYQVIRDNNDILYSALLPQKKRDVVTAKFLIAAMIELSGVAVMAVLTILRMTVLKDFPPYVSNVMMPATLTFLGFALLIFGEFNFIFIRGFFKTSYYFGKPFIIFIIVSVLTVGVGETLHHLPFVDYYGVLFQTVSLISGAALCFLLTFIAWRQSQHMFEKTDL